MPIINRVDLRASKISNSTTIDSDYDLFLFSKSIGNCSKGTIEFYREKKKNIVSWFGSHELHDLSEVSANDIREFLSDYRKTHTDSGTFKIFSVFRTFINWYWDEYDLDIRNPITKVKMPRKAPDPVPGITLEEIDQMLQAARNSDFPERNIAIVNVLADTGIRKSGFSNLRFMDVDTAHWEIRAFGKNQKWSTKPLGNNARKALKRYFSLISDVKPDDHIWLGKDGSFLQPDGIRDVLIRLQELAGAKTIHQFHAFRRFYGLSLYKSTGDIYFVSRMLDHSNVEVTKRYLDIKNDDDLIKAAKLSPMDQRRR